ncbi:hypothetical protein BBN63_08175 [Streptomyces niveus]|uniref:Uncharacterized protein n=1 Tax=Streptomyces niveus TaxID=193462 RepID=A0A1U9QPX5_STRNV|nr:hypothetical protein BBN63_08175 [Streptomyces niveus]
MVSAEISLTGGVLPVTSNGRRPLYDQALDPLSTTPGTRGSVRVDVADARPQVVLLFVNSAKSGTK